MADLDYEKLGFKCGIEIHQQLSGKKLFCNCSAESSGKEPDIKITRKLRAVAGETGQIDAAAQHEMQKSRTFTYVANSGDICLVELDEEPPHPINKDSLNVAIEVAMHLNAKLVDEIQVMRKTVVDGSNVSGFQRTALIAIDGYVDTSLGKVRIPVVCLEEEAAQKLEETKDGVTFKLDRLGVPLIEIATDPDIKNPSHAKEVAEKIGMVLRSTGKVKRGIGTIRQDVNVSIKGGARVEVKGFQDLKSIPKVIDFEIERQLKLIKQGKKISNEVRKAEPDGTTSYLRPMPSADRMYPETDVDYIKPSVDNIELSELLEEKMAKYEKDYGLGADLAKAIAKQQSSLFEKLVKRCKNIKPSFIAEWIISGPKELRRKHNIETVVPEENIIELFMLINDSKIAKESFMDALLDIAKCSFDPKKYAAASADEVEEFVKKIVAKNKDLNMGALMGMVMAKYRGKVDGKTVSMLVQKYMK